MLCRLEMKDVDTGQMIEQIDNLLVTLGLAPQTGQVMGAVTVLFDCQSELILPEFKEDYRCVRIEIIEQETNKLVMFWESENCCKEGCIRLGR